LIYLGGVCIDIEKLGIEKQEIFDFVKMRSDFKKKNISKLSFFSGLK
jgi:hypothetical protein